MTRCPDPARPPCTVYWARPVPPGDAPALLGLLDAHERSQLDRLRRPQDAARYLAGHALTRLVLADLVGTSPQALVLDRRCGCGADHGKPRLVDGEPPGFSLTHSGGLVGVAVAPDTPVGLDVEQERRLADLAGVAALIRSPQDEDEVPFFVTWARKEALLKATGVGLTADMSAVAIGRGLQVGWTGPHAPPGPMWVRDLPVPAGHRAAIAGPGACPPPLRTVDGDALLHLSPGP